VIAVDTNVVVRLLTNDDTAQAARAVDLFAHQDILIVKTVLLETEWVLRYSYGLPAAAILAAFRRVLGLPSVAAEDAPAVVLALSLYEGGMDFADALHLSSGREAEAFATFDLRLKKRVGRRARVKVL
jgi:predicted nucleic-acid-binding protein